MKSGVKKLFEKGICYVSAIVFVFSACAFESETNVFYVSAFISLLVLIIIGIKNGVFE